MRINELQQSNTVASGNVFAIDTDNGTFKIDYDVLAAAIINQHRIFFNVATWADVYGELSSLGAGETAPMLVGTAVVSLLTNGAVPSGGLTGTVGATNPNAGRYTFFATHYNCDFSCMWEINGLTSASATPTVINFNKFESAYKAGSTYTFDNAPIGMAGYVSAGLTKMEFFLPLPKSLANVNAISCTSFNGVIRGVSGYVNSVGTNTEWTTMSGITVSVAKAGDSMVRITFNSSSALTNLTNNTPLHAYGTITLSFT